MKPLIFLFNSFKCDIDFFSLSIPFKEKIVFIFKKYLLLLKNLLIGFTINKSNIRIFGHDYYFNERSGIAILQCDFIDHDILKKYIKINSVIIDVGANIGQFRLFCEYSLKTKNIYSFEPAHGTFQTLTKNFSQNIYNFAITNQPNLNLFTSQNQTLVASIFPQGKDDIMESVNCKKLDDIDDIKNESLVGLLKIDTEGSELDVLKSGTCTLKKTKYLLVEASLKRASSGGFVELIKWLGTDENDFDVVEIGKYYVSDGIPVAVDILFQNRKLV